MDYIALLVAGVFLAIALAFVVLSFSPATPAATVAQDPPGQATSVRGDCGSPDCVSAAIQECRQSEMTVTHGNETQVITVGGNGTYQGRPVCMIAVNEVSDKESLQSASCKVPVSELSNMAADISRLGDRLAADNHCGLQVP